MEFKYCRRCGEQLLEKAYGAYACSNQHEIFMSPVPGASLYLIDADLNVYLARRASEPGKGMLGSLGGFMDIGETAEQTAIREAEEESGLLREDYGQIHFLNTATNDYVFRGETLYGMSVSFWAQVHDANIAAIAGDDVTAIEKIPLRDIDLNSLYGDNTKSSIARLKALLLDSSS